MRVMQVQIVLWHLEAGSWLERQQCCTVREGGRGNCPGAHPAGISKQDAITEETSPLSYSGAQQWQGRRAYATVEQNK